MSRLREQSGIAMPVALSVLLLMTLLAGAALAVSMHTSAFTNGDANSKAALEAADAGQRVAVYRLNMVRPADTECVIAASPYHALPTGGYCQNTTSPAPPESLGNRASFNYWMTPTMTAGSTCAGLSVQNQAGIVQRCVTAVGTANGESVRTETRVAAFGAAPLFPVAGLLGLKRVTIAPNAVINGTAGSNGTITVNNNAYVLATVTGPAGNVTTDGNATVVTQNPPNANPFVLSPVDPGNSAQAANNTNNRITNCASHTPPYDACTNTTLDASRRLTVSNNGSLTLGGGTYNFCSMTISNNSTITLGAGVKTRIFIDSPDNPNSGCPAGSGTMSLSNNVNVINASADPTALQFYVYGWNDGQNVVTFTNNSITYATLYAPQSTVNVANNAATFGAISGNYVNVNNNMTFNWGASAGGLQARSTGLYFRTAWKQCRPTPTTAGQPQSGC